ncbi:MAG: hypothetical protein IJL92_02020 [Thermoguttaceae bacterium]|nr:hypothetical protein [Thermoguttaceae bacterium]
MAVLHNTKLTRKTVETASRRTLCRFLGVNEYAAPSEIRQAFREVSRKYHPDVLSACTQKEKAAGEALYRVARDVYIRLTNPFDYVYRTLLGDEPSYYNSLQTVFIPFKIAMLGGVHGVQLVDHIAHATFRYKLKIRPQTLSETIYKYNIPGVCRRPNMDYDLPNPDDRLPTTFPNLCGGILVKIQPDSDYRREKLNLVRTIFLSKMEAQCGLRTPVETLSAYKGHTQTIPVKPGTVFGSKTVFRGYGFEDPKTRLSGDLIVVFAERPDYKLLCYEPDRAGPFPTAPGQTRGTSSFMTPLTMSLKGPSTPSKSVGLRR